MVTRLFHFPSTAAAAFCRHLFPYHRHHRHRLPPHPLPLLEPMRFHLSFYRNFSSSTDPPTPPPPPPPPRFTNTTASFDWSDDDEKTATDSTHNKAKEIDKSKLPPPYDPFNKKPMNPKDPSNLQQIFHNMRTDGLVNHAVKMFDGLSKDGLTHEALELFSLIKDKGAMPDVVAHTAVIEAYANAGGRSKEAVKTYERMLASGVLPNAYTYSVLIQGLAKDGKVSEARKHLLEMLGKGMKPNAKTYTAVFEAFVREKKEGEARELLKEMRGNGFAPDEKAVREQLGRRGQMFRSLMSLLFGK